MKILITGGYGFIGSHVAEKFHREGHQIYILDNLSKGNPENLSFRHTFYKLDVEDEKCRDIFRSNKFDVVVHLAAQISVCTSMENPGLDARTNLLGLVNMLSLSGRYHVGRFIFASSAAVYGNNTELPLREESGVDPQSPYGLGKLTGEEYCKKWNAIFGLNTLCCRFSNVYGPRQGTRGEGGAVSIFMERQRNGRKIDVFGDGTQTRDFIYVEDIAEALYKASFCDYCGILNISSNMENSIQDLVSLLDRIKPLQGVEYKERKEGDILHSRLDNAKAKRVLDWVPMTTFEEGIGKTFEWFSSYTAGKAGNLGGTWKERKKPLLFSRLWNSRLMPYAENLLAFLLVAVLTFAANSGSNSMVLDYKLLYIVLIGVIYGARQSMISVALSCILYIASFLHMGRDAASLIYDTNSLLQLTFYILIGISIGYTIDRKSSEIDSREALLRASEEKYSLLCDIHRDTLQVKDELQNQIIHSRDSFGKVYKAVKLLGNLDTENIFSSVVSVVEEIMHTSQVAIYLINDTGYSARLAAKSNCKGFEMEDVLKVEDREDIMFVLNREEIYANRQLLPEVPVFTAPILLKGRVLAVVSLHQVEFENVTLFWQNRFVMLMDLISYSLANTRWGLKTASDKRIINV